jgi:protein involved in polysaccharide export with SLBB domain
MTRTLIALSTATSLIALSEARPLPAQTTTPPTRNAQATRSELESMLAAAQRDTAAGSETDRGRKRLEVNMLQDRLTNGDFQVGDRVLIFVQGQPTLSDTLTVREGQTLHLANLGDISLHGVLRSELQGHVYEAVTKYLRSPVVRTGSLVRIAVLGDVRNPGFYAVPADMLISDAIMHAGGLANTSDIGRTTIKRGPEVVWQSKDVSAAVRDGATIDQLSLRAGDQIEVGAKKTNALLIALPIIGGVVGIVTGIVLITGKR